MSLLLAYSGKYAVQVLVFLLYVRALAAQQQFAGFSAVAGLIFIGNAHGHDIQLLEVLLEAALAAHIEHFKQSLLSLVYAVFGPSFLLGYPYRRFAGCNGKPYIFGQGLGIQVHLPGADAANDLNHAVGLQQILYKPVTQ